MIKIRNIKNISFNIIAILHFYMFKFISCELNECPRDTPIRIGEECLSTYCSKLNLEQGICSISNQIIKTQFLNNIILVGDKDFRFLKFMTSSNGELLLSISSCPKNKIRIYYGIDLNGLPIFKDSSGNNVYTIKKIIKRNDPSIERYESQAGLIKINGDSNNNKEYFINLGKSKTYIEIFDYIDYNNNLIEMAYNQTINVNIKSYFGSFFNIIESNINYNILAIISSDNKFLIMKLKFEYLSNGKIKCTKITEKPFDAYDSRIVTCYNNENIIVCAYVSTTTKYKIIVLDFSFNNKKNVELQIISQLSTSFHKLIHLKGEIGLFSYYQGIENDYPSIQIIEIKKSGSSYNINLKGNFNLNKYYCQNQALLTDFIKIRDNLVCLTSAEKNKEILIIIVINFYNTLEYNVRYYIIKIFELYYQKILRDIIISPYNNNLALAFSYCPQTTCNEDEDEHYSSLIFFCYPNTKNFTFDMINYLNKEENNDLIIDLFDNITIDNNIFGFIIDGIKIYSIDNCCINFTSNIKNETIKNNDILKENEKLELILTKDEYEKTNCTISYSLIITEPDYDEYNKYPNFILKENDVNEKKNFTKYSYEGKV